MSARGQLNAAGLHPKKRFGQNFLLDDSLCVKIADLALADSPEYVVEVGPGTGALTAALVREGRGVRALEIDRDLVALLRERSDLSSVDILEADALTYAWPESSFERWHVAGNLPYNIATPLLVTLAQLERGPQRIVAMIQKDVADRLLAAPGSAAYGSLTVAISNTMEIRRAFTLGPGAFYPRPKVDSTVIVLNRRARPLVEPIDSPLFEKVVRGSFAYRRKTLANSLSRSLSVERAEILIAMQAAGIDEDERGERLDIDSFARLADALARRGV
ncbi:MAG: ribosomal RNA small subunit methyltransferase A [Candidatus Eremiobacteraeota bacterium]|nr:ribosomal RNA small subunit methyltransferase A [Candidatus Eremiobacteraeota bacterium]